MEFQEGDRVKVQKNGIEYEGIFMPSTSDHMVIKMDSGYNAGIDLKGATVLVVHKKKDRIISDPSRPKDTVQLKKDLPKVSILSTGGTIASKIDYRTGAVSSQFSADDILQAIPELTEIATFSGRAIYNILSENMKAAYWQELAKAVAEEIEGGADGVIIAHGTDTMMYSAAALSFMIDTPVPIVFVGSQRSADRPSSDNVMNAICAARVAVSDIAEVSVVMHGDTSDDRCYIHRATKVRKMHTSKRDAFRSINSSPIGCVDYATGEIQLFLPYIMRNERQLVLKSSIEAQCTLVKFTPGANPDILGWFVDQGYKGIVIEGTGLGHVSTEWIPQIERATSLEIPVFITSQCLSGRICNRVYDTGRDIIKAGAIEGEDMLSEVALVKMMWALGQSDDYNTVCDLLKNNIIGEINERSTLCDIS